MRVWLLCVAAGGCHLAFGVDTVGPFSPIDAAADAATAPDAPALPPADLDMDSVPDDQDPCIAPTSDATADSDGDGALNASDHCPLVPGGLTTNTDNDDLADACDPHPGIHDTLRCVMAFTSSNLNDRLWQPVSSVLPFAHAIGKLHCDGGTSCGTVAAEPVAPPGAAITYEARFQLSTLSQAGGVAIWPRLDPVNGAGNVGCGYIDDAGQYYVTLLNGAAILQRKPTQAIVFPPLYLRASVSGSTVTCNASFNGTYDGATEVTAVATVGTGNLGFTSATWTTDLLGLEIISTP